MLFNILIEFPITLMTWIIGLLPSLSSVPASITAVFDVTFGTLKAYDWLIPYTPIAITILFVTHWYAIEITFKLFMLLFKFKKIKA